MSKIYKQITDFRDTYDLWQLIEMAGATEDPIVLEYWALATSPIQAQADLGRTQLVEMLTQSALYNQTFGAKRQDWPDTNPETSTLFGYECGTDRPVYIPLVELTAHTLNLGKTGYGKSTAFFHLMPQLNRKGVKCVFLDLKNEGRRMIHVYERIVVLPLTHLPINLLDPPGLPERYFLTFANELGRVFGLPTASYSKLPELLLRLYNGRQESESFLSLVDLAKVLDKLKQEARSSTFSTLANCLANLNVSLGQTARVRKGVIPEHLYDFVVYEAQGLPSRLVQFISALWLTHFQEIARLDGHERDQLSLVRFSDEGELEFHKNLSSGSAGYIPPQVRMATQIRSTGSGLAVGAQNISNVCTELKNNVRTVQCFHLSDGQEVKEAASLLGLPENRAHEISTLDKGECFLRCGTLFKEPVRLKVPFTNPGEYISDSELESTMQPEWRKLQELCEYSPKAKDTGAPLDYREILGEREKEDEIPPEPEQATDPNETLKGSEQFFDEWHTFLKDAQKHPKSNARERVKNLGWSAGKTQRVKQALIDNGLVCEEIGKVKGGRPPKYITLTPLGEKFLKINEAR